MGCPLSRVHEEPPKRVGRWYLAGKSIVRALYPALYPVFFVLLCVCWLAAICDGQAPMCSQVQDQVSYHQSFHQSLLLTVYIFVLCALPLPYLRPLVGTSMFNTSKVRSTHKRHGRRRHRSRYTSLDLFKRRKLPYGLVQRCLRRVGNRPRRIVGPSRQELCM